MEESPSRYNTVNQRFDKNYDESNDFYRDGPANNDQ